MPPLIKLLSYVKGEIVEVVQLDSGEISVGREPDNAISVQNDSISRHHGVLYSAGNQWVFEDKNSTNGSWVNGVQIRPGQVRLIRDGDSVQLANFLLKVEAVDASGEWSRTFSGVVEDGALSLVVYKDGAFQSEYVFRGDDARYVVGGPGADLELDGDSSGLLISVQEGRLELSVEQSSVPVIVNGLAVGGMATLNDGDEIDVGPYKLVATDINFWRPMPVEQLAVPARERASSLSGAQGGAGVGSSAAGSGAEAGGESGDASGEVPLEAFDQPQIPQPYQPPETKLRGWESALSETEEEGHKKFIFGAKPEGGDPTDTMELEAYEVDPRFGAELSTSQRFSGFAEEDEDTPGLNDKILAFFGILVFLGVLVGLLIVLLT